MSLQSDLNEPEFREYVEKTLKRVQASTTDRSLVMKGLGPCREKAAETLEELVPAEFHFGYVFSKQDVYRLKKVGLSFCEAEAPDIESAARHSGYLRLMEVEPRGTRMCTGGDKVMQSIAQSVTALLKRSVALIWPVV